MRSIPQERASARGGQTLAPAQLGGSSWAPYYIYKKKYMDVYIMSERAYKYTVNEGSPNYFSITQVIAKGVIRLPGSKTGAQTAQIRWELLKGKKRQVRPVLLSIQMLEPG